MDTGNCIKHRESRQCENSKGRFYTLTMSVKMVIQFALLAFLSVLQPGYGQVTDNIVNSKLFLFLIILLTILFPFSATTQLHNIQQALTGLIDYVKEVKDELRSLREDMNSSVNDLSMYFEEHKNRTAAELASLTIKMETINSKMETLDSKVETHNSRMQSSQETHTQQINTLNSKLDTLTATTAQLSTDHQNLQTDISDVECTDSEESLELYQNLTHQLENIQSGVNNIRGPYTCGGTGGWRRVVYLDMTDNSTTCPSGWQLTGYSKRTCGRVSTGPRTCDSATFPVSGGEYTRVCGRIKAYQWGGTVAFYSINSLTITMDIGPP